MSDSFFDNAVALTALDNVDNVTRCQQRSTAHCHMLRISDSANAAHCAFACCLTANALRSRCQRVFSKQ
jgi:hypothetical protein